MQHKLFLLLVAFIVIGVLVLAGILLAQGYSVYFVLLFVGIVLGILGLFGTQYK